MAPLDLVTETATASTEELPEPSCPRDAGEIDRGQRMLVEGRALRLKSANASEMNNAVELLSQSCELLAKQCGQLALEVAPSYLEYGTALLDLERLTGGPEAFLSAVKEAVSQQTANMLAGAEGNDEMTEKEGEAAGKEEGKEEKQESQTSKEADVEKATSGEPAESGTATEAKEEEAEEKKEETTAEEQKEEEGAEGEGEEGEDEEEGEEGGEEMDSAAEDEDNLGLSWEMVDLARTIYEKEGMVADEVRCRLLLAEVATENDDFERAQGELAAVLANGATKPRQRAEAFYLRGVGEGLKNEYKTATVSFGEAIKAVEQCIELEKSDDEKKVLAELKADMAKRLAEVQEDCKEQLPKEIIAERLGGDHGNEFDAGKLDVQATDSVTHLVRKKEKRAVEEGAEGEAKRAKVDEAAE